MKLHFGSIIWWKFWCCLHWSLNYFVLLHLTEKCRYKLRLIHICAIKLFLLGFVRSTAKDLQYTYLNNLFLLIEVFLLHSLSKYVQFLRKITNKTLYLIILLDQWIVKSSHLKIWYWTILKTFCPSSDIL